VTDKEIISWCQAEYKRADAVANKKEANQIRHRAKTIFDKRFPNPTICPCCGRAGE